MNNQAIHTVSTSDEPVEVKRAALDLARSVDAADLNALSGCLNSPDFYHKLDSAEDYQRTFSTLRLAGVTGTLSENTSQAAVQILLRLTTSEVFNADVLRMQLLIRALIPIRPSPPAAIAYWDKLSVAESPIAQDVIEALCSNQSPPAMTLLESKFKDTQAGKAAKVVWMRKLILPRRNDEPLLLCSERLLKAGQPGGAQNELVEALFSYNVQWYRGCDPPKAPPLALASAPAKEAYLRIADHALTRMTLPPDLKAKVEATQGLLKPKS